MAEFDPVLAELRKVKGGITMLVKQGVDAVSYTHLTLPTILLV